MRIFLKVFSFFIISGLGALTVPALLYILKPDLFVSLYAVGVLKVETLDLKAAGIDAAQFQSVKILMFQNSFAWLVSVCFSFASFFFKSSLRFIFLLAPIYVPLSLGIFYILTAL